MSKKTENDIRMAQTVHEVLNNNEDTWEAVKGFADEVAESRSLMRLLKQTRVSVKKKSKGVTEDKAKLQEAAITMGVDLAERAGVYLRKNKQMEMFEQLNVSRSELRLTPDSDLVAKLMDMYEQLSSIVDKLTDYNVNEDNLNAFAVAIGDFDEMLPKPRGVQIKVQRDNQAIAGLIEQIKASFVNMDDLMNNFRGSKFAIEFKNARNIIELGSRHEKPSDEEEQNEDMDDEQEEGADDEKDEEV